MKKEYSIPIFKWIIMLSTLITLVVIVSYLYPSTDIDKIVKETNQRLEYSIIRSAPSFIVPREGGRALKKPIRSLIITINDEYIEKVVHFEVMKYTIATGGSFTNLPKPIKELFVAIQQAYDKENKLIDAIGEVEISADFAKKFKLSTKLKALAEMLYSIQRLIEIKTNHVDIYIRGYADGQLND